MNLMEQITLYFQDNSIKYWTYVGEHIKISLLALIMSLIIALPLGYFGSKNPLFSKICTGFTQFLRIIPTLALLFILIPFIGVGTIPALIALF
ncbi:MAG: ABC transporter permease, partial [Leuconostoc gelidum]